MADWIMSKTREGEFCVIDVATTGKVAVIPCERLIGKPAEWENNARLIAAAPELLAALEELSAYSASDVDANEASFEQARAHARAAIAKATA